MAWYLFNDETTFNSWHESLKIELSLPSLSIDKDGNKTDPLNTDYTKLIKSYGDNRLVAWVDDKYSTGLTETIQPHFEPIER